MKRKIILSCTVTVIIVLIVIVAGTSNRNSTNNKELQKSTIPTYATGSDIYDCYNIPLRDYALTFIKETSSDIEAYLPLRAEITQIGTRYNIDGDLTYQIYINGPAGKWRFTTCESDEGNTFSRMSTKKLRDYVTITFDNNCNIVDIQ